MIAKGASRSGPRQLAVYLMRVERYDTGEPAELLELQSPWADAPNGSRTRTAAKLVEAFRDWQTLTEGTKQGRDGLYHAEISPEARYASTMTHEQWKRAADILGQELGLQDQERALVLHGGTDGRKHLHIVWARTDIDRMKLVSDSQNYLAHERASQRMELEFGQDFVPGKHAKRDRKKQPEFPRQEYSQADAQQAQRTEMTVPERKAQMTALHATANGGQAFKSALEDAGYVLAKGERGYLAVDEAGEHYSLARYIKGMKKARLEEFMAGVDLDKLPTIEEAKALQQERPLKAGKAAPEASQLLPPEPPPQIQQPTPAPADAELEALQKALAERQAKEAGKWADLNAHELRQLEFGLENLNKTKTDDFDAIHRQERDALQEAHKQRRTGIMGFIDAVQLRLNPRLAEEQGKQRRRESAQQKRRQEQERKDYTALIEQTKQLEIENLKARQGLQRQDQERKFGEERERYVRDHHEAKRILAGIEAQRLKEELERNESLRDGPPPPKLGK